MVKASNFIKYSAWEAAISATASCGAGDWYRFLFTNLFSFDRSTHRLISVDHFSGARTIGAHHSVGSVTCLITPSVCLTLTRYEYWMDLGAVRKMVYHSPPIQYENRPQKFLELTSGGHFEYWYHLHIPMLLGKLK